MSEPAPQVGSSDCDFPVTQAEIRAEERAEERRALYLEINAGSEYNKAICWKQLGGEQPCPQAVARGSSPEREQGLTHCTRHVTNTAQALTGPHTLLLRRLKPALLLLNQNDALPYFP